MSKKNNFKKHEIAIYLTLLSDALDDVKADNSEALEIQKLARELSSKIDPIVDDLYQLKGISKTTYFQNIENKIKTIIRKNYELIES